MATGSKIARGFAVTCPHCKDSDATISLELADVHTLRCSGCDEEFSPQQARDMVAAELEKWQAVCRWVDMVPAAWVLAAADADNAE